MTLPAAPTTETTPELLYLLSADPDEFADVAGALPPADIADALRQLPPEPAAKVLAALPFDVAVRVLDEPELEYDRAGIVCKLDLPAASRLIDAMSADQQADLFRDLPTGRPRAAPPAAQPAHAARADTAAAVRARHGRRHDDDGVPERRGRHDRREHHGAHPAGERQQGDGVRDLRHRSGHAGPDARRVAARTGAGGPRDR